MVDLIDTMKKEWAIRYNGAKMTPEDAAREWALMPFEKRVAHMLTIETPDSMTPIQAAERYKFERVLKTVHSTLQKVGR